MQPKETISLIVGTYTGAGSEGIYIYRFDQENGTASGVRDMAPICNPSYLEISRDGRFVYAVTEVSDSRASLSSFAFENSSLRLQGTVPTGDGDPCFVSTNGKLVLTANFGGSLSAFPIAHDGSLGEPERFNGTVGGPDARRQATPHVHCAVFSPDGKHVFASDFSADRIMRFDVSNDGYALKKSGYSAPVHPDYGPRHMAFSPDGRHLYVIGELSGDITVFDYADGILTEKQCIKADKVDARGAADIHISPDGRFLYASLRLRNDGIAIFEILQDGTLRSAGYQATGIHPRNFNITPNGRFLLCACRDSNEIEVFRIDPATGLLEDTGSRISQSKPVCVKFVVICE